MSPSKIPDGLGGVESASIDQAESAVGDTSGNGGDGLMFDISGTMVFYAGGGGGGTNTSAGFNLLQIIGTGGLGGGGNGSKTDAPGADGMAGTGGGGGGGCAYAASAGLSVGGSGGSGIVIVQFVVTN
jgi:hypothetical protein